MEQGLDQFPVWGLVPKNETGVTAFLAKHPEYNGKGVTIAILDSGVDPGAPGLQETPDGRVKVIERYDCSGNGDVAMVEVDVNSDNTITGLSGKKLKIPAAWPKPVGKYRVGIKNAFSLYPERLQERVRDETKKKRWEPQHKLAVAASTRKLTEFEERCSEPTDLEDKLAKENLEAELDYLNSCDKKYTDLGAYYDCVLFHNGDYWMACVDTTEEGDLKKCSLLGEYSKTHDFAPLTEADQLNFSFNVHDEGKVLELVGLCSSHGTHVASITAAYFEDDESKNGVAPGAQIISLTIGDGRLGSMETGTGVVRAIIKIMEMQKTHKIDVINMSYGEHAHWASHGRIGELMNEVINKYGIVWVASAGNHGPALSTIGTPPNISQDIVIGVGAYVSPDMMLAEYAMTTKTKGMPYTWSSRGPTIDGGPGVSVCAPGGAITSVPNFTLRNSQLMNGTSMAAPHVAGAVGLLLAGLKAKDLPYSPYSVKRALENGATQLKDTDPFAVGSGLLNVEKSFDLLSEHCSAAERNVRFHITCGANNMKGVYIRNKSQQDYFEFSITVEPCFLDSDEIPACVKINFNLKLALVCNESYVRYPKHLDLSNMSRAFALKIDTRGLPMLSHTYLEAYDVNCTGKGPVFKIPITIIKPMDIVPPRYSTTETLMFHTNMLHRKFIHVPENATWATLRMRCDDLNSVGKFVIHCMHLLPNQSCRSLELNKNINLVPTSDTVISFQVRGDTTLEVVIAKYWASIGDLEVEYGITFYGIKPSEKNITMLAADGVHPVEITTLQGEDIVPNITLKNSTQILRPSDSKIASLTERDIIPPGRQIYELNLTYNFHLNKGTEVSPNCPMLSDVLYESEFESQLWMLFDCNKQVLGCGDYCPSKFTVKLEKGDYVIKLHVRHDKKEYLEKLLDTPMLLSQKLSSNISLDVYSNYSNAIVGGKKATVFHHHGTNKVRMYIAPLASEKYSGKSNNTAHYLTGTVTYARDEQGKRVDTYPFKYVLGETSKKATKSEKTKSKAEEFKEALRELKSHWLAKLDGGVPTQEGKPEKLAAPKEVTPSGDALYEEMTKECPDYLPTYTAYLQILDPMDAKHQLPVFDANNAVLQQKKENLQKIIKICDMALSEINEDTLLKHAASKCDKLDSNLKQMLDRQKTVLIDCTCRKGIALCQLEVAGGDSSHKDDIVKTWKDLTQFVDPNDTKTYSAHVMYFAAWHATILKQYGRLIKYLQRINDEKPVKDIDEKLIELYELLEWPHMVNYYKRCMPAKYPHGYRPF